MLCSRHMGDDQHDCTYDYRGAAISSLTAALPKVGANKRDGADIL